MGWLGVLFIEIFFLSRWSARGWREDGGGAIGGARVARVRIPTRRPYLFFLK